MSKMAKGKQLEAFACGPRVVLISCGCPRRHIALEGSTEPLCGKKVSDGSDFHEKGEPIRYRRVRLGTKNKMPPICQACLQVAPRAIFVREEW